MSRLPFRQIHLDFHTSEQIPGIGKAFDAQEFVDTLKAANVNSINLFGKCHHGMLYYDSKLEAKHPHLTCNLLKEQVDACHANGIKAPIYISAGLDEFSAAAHPEWQELAPDGKLAGTSPLEAGWRKICLNNPHYLEYLEENTEEILDLFGSECDGIWYDIILQSECLCSHCMKDMLAAGLDPTSPGDRRVFSRGVADSFKKRITAFIRTKNENCDIFYNAGHIDPGIRRTLDTYTHLELESLPSGGWGYDHFPVTARYARNLGYDFLGMTGKFLKSWADFGGFKNEAALEYDCFTALSLGGKCCVGDQLHPTGKITRATYDLIGGVYKQVEDKEPWCSEVDWVTEIGVLNPELVSGRVALHGLNQSAAGVHRMLSEKHYQYDFVDFEMDLSKYKVLILPDMLRLTQAQADMIDEYLKAGGKAIFSYESGMGKEGQEFLIEGMPARVAGDAKYSPDYLVAQVPIAAGIPETEHVMYDRGYELELAPGAQSLAEVWKPYFERNYLHFSSHFHTCVEGPAGYPGIVAKGNIVYIGYPIFRMYKQHGTRVYREMVINALKLLLADGEKLVTTSAPSTADITLNYQPAEDRYILHVLHYIPEHRFVAVDTFEDRIPLHSVEVSLLLPEGYDKASLVPANVELQSNRANGRVSFEIPKIEGHCMVEITK